MSQKHPDERRSKEIFCTVCAQTGKKVEMFTVRSVTKDDFSRKLCDDNYYFCSNPECRVVYYGTFRDSIVEKDRLKTRIGLKEKESPRPVCYCFGYTIEDVHREIIETGKSTIEKDITNRIEDGLCHCQDANPEGRCCLGNVGIAVREAFRLYVSAGDRGSDKSERQPQDCCKAAMTGAE